MNRRLAVPLLLGALCVLPALAQRPAPHPLQSAQDSSARVVGTWEGTVELQGQSGGMELTVARDSVWRATMEFHVDHPFPAVPLRDFKVAGDTVSWTNDLMASACNASALLENGNRMSGQMVCGERTLGFSLAKR